MTGAELKTLRESLGLTVQWLADQAGVRLRTVQYWEAGRNRVPADVAELITTIDNQFERAAAESVRMAVETTPPPVLVTLVRYRADAELWEFRPDMRPLPATAHAALLSRVRRGLEAAGIHNVIQFMDATDLPTLQA